MPVVRISTEIRGLGGSPGYSRQHFEVADASPGSTDMDFAKDAVEAMWQELIPYVSAPVMFEVLDEAAIINPATGQTTGVVPIDGTSFAGAAAGDALPWITQGLLRLRTGVYSNGREARGRVFIPGLNESLSQAGRPSPTFVDELTGIGQQLFAEGAATPVVISKGVAVPVIAVSAWNEWAYLGSRRD